MLYEITHFVQDKMPWVWNMVEWANAEVFALQHRKGLNEIPVLLEKYTDRFRVVVASEEDAKAMAKFFTEQPEEAFKFFHPHEFDEKSLQKLINRKSFLMFLVKDCEEIVGYFFLRCFANGKAFKGRMVDYRRRNQGIGKLMGNVLNEVVWALDVKLFTTISPENYSSLASVKAVNDIKILKTLENGYYYIECTPKKSDDSSCG